MTRHSPRQDSPPEVAKAENDLAAFKQAIEEYFDGTAVMDIERRAQELSRIPPHKRSPMEHERDE